MSIDERIAKRAKTIRLTPEQGLQVDHADLLDTYVSYLACRELLIEAETKSDRFAKDLSGWFQQSKVVMAFLDPNIPLCPKEVQKFQEQRAIRELAKEDLPNSGEDKDSKRVKIE